MWFGSKEQSWVAAELVNLIRFDETQMEFEAWMKTTSKLENSVQGWENFNKQTFNFSREHSYLDCSTWSDYTRTRCSYFPTFSILSHHPFEVLFGTILPKLVFSCPTRLTTQAPKKNCSEILPRLWMTLQTRCSRSDAERQRRSWGCKRAEENNLRWF